MRQDFLKTLEEVKIMIADGGMATELEALGCNLNHELWSAKVLADQPELIKQVHLNYFEAGADCAMTSTYQATIPRYVEFGYTVEQAEEFIVRSVELLKEARALWWQVKGQYEGRVYPIISAAVGPYGAYLADGSEYKGHYGLTKEELKTFHRRRMELMWEAGADIFDIETTPSLEEAIALAELTEELGASCWICFSCKDEATTNEGTPIAECMKALERFDCVKAVGVNCTAPRFVTSLITEIKTVTTKPIIVFPNSGKSYDPVTKTWSGHPDGLTYADFAKQWVDAGASIVGGCCQTTPQDISDIYQLFR